jgi:hypothetical protein
LVWQVSPANVPSNGGKIPMRLIPAALLAGAASLVLAGGAYAASRHVMTVDLPDGGVARIAYEGNVAPKVSIVPARRVAVPVAYVDPFARMDAMFAVMQRQHDAMIRQAAALAAQADAGAMANGAAPLMVVSATGAPAGGHFTYVSTTTTRDGTCGHSVRIVQRAGAQPQRVERSFGDCSASAAPAPHAAPSAAPAQAPVPVQPVV